MTAVQLWGETCQTRNRFLGSRLLALLLVLVSCWRRELGLVERLRYRRRYPGRASSFLGLPMELELELEPRFGPQNLGRHCLEQQRLLHDRRDLLVHGHGPYREGHHGLLEPYQLSCAVYVSWSVSIGWGRSMIGCEMDRGSRCHVMVSPKSHKCQ